MKKSRLQKFAWVFFALALGTTTVFAQGWRNGNRVNNSQNDLCLQQVSDLTETQETAIAELSEQHQAEMAELREERRATTDAIEKNEIRGEMLENVEAQRAAVKDLLTEEQQAEYDALHASNATLRGNGNGNAQRGRQGNAVRQGRGRNNNSQQGQGRNRANQGQTGSTGVNYNQPGCIYYNDTESNS